LKRKRWRIPVESRSCWDVHGTTRKGWGGERKEKSLNTTRRQKKGAQKGLKRNAVKGRCPEYPPIARSPERREGAITTSTC